MIFPAGSGNFSTFALSFDPVADDLVEGDEQAVLTLREIHGSGEIGVP